TIASVAMSGKIVTLTIATPVTSSSTVVVGYAVPALNALHDAAANTVAPFTRTAANQTPLVAPPSGAAGGGDAGGSGGGTIESPGLTVVSASPDDGSTVGAAATITLTANQAARWSQLTVTRPDGSVSGL